MSTQVPQAELNEDVDSVATPPTARGPASRTRGATAEELAAQAEAEEQAIAMRQHEEELARQFERELEKVPDPLAAD